MLRFKYTVFSAFKEQEKCNYCKKSSSCNSCNIVKELEDESDKKRFFTSNKNVNRLEIETIDLIYIL